MANANNMGGDYLTGGETQEESIFRRTNLDVFLLKCTYFPIGDI